MIASLPSSQTVSRYAKQADDSNWRSNSFHMPATLLTSYVQRGLVGDIISRFEKRG